MLRICRLISCWLLPAISFALDQAAYTAAVELYAQRKPLEAQRAFEALALTAPAQSDIQFYLGRLALQRNDAAQAVVYLEKAVALTPNDSRLRHRLGDAYGLSARKAGLFAQMSWANKCLASYEQAVALNSKNLEARAALMNYYLQAPSLVGGGKDKALGQALEIKRQDVAAGRLAMAAVHLADKKYALAFQEYDEALRANPNDYTALFQVGRLAAITGEQPERGLKLLRQCLELKPTENAPPHAAVHWRIGFILAQQGDHANARQAYEAALKLDPQFAPARASLKELP
jgi:tetratricopeptide (TPR) repeat protein